MRSRNLDAALAATIVATFLGCGEGPPEEDAIPLAGDGEIATATAAWAPDTLSAAGIEAGRLDASWRLALTDDSLFADDTVPPASLPVSPLDLDGWEDLVRTSGAADTAGTRTGPTADGLPPVRLPLHGDVEGPSVLYVQILLDRARFSPGILDGKWGKNTEKAVYWFQRAEGIEPTGAVDSLTYGRLVERAGGPERFVRTVELTEEDVAGPFVDIPGDVYRQADLECLCYSSVAEKVGERFHASPELLGRLNPDVDLDALSAGDSIAVPNVDRTDLTDVGRDDAAADRSAASGLPPIARLVVSDAGHWLHALDGEGRIVHHFPTTLGSEYSPSPSGRLEIASIAFDPWFHYQPDLLDDVDPTEPDVRLPPGPNSPVGIVWMQLSRDHYGIHGTDRPETIGYVTSNGCVRLTNWDARFLGERVAPGVPVEFVDLRPRGGAAAGGS